MKYCVPPGPEVFAVFVQPRRIADLVVGQATKPTSRMRGSTVHDKEKIEFFLFPPYLAKENSVPRTLNVQNEHLIQGYRLHTSLSDAILICIHKNQK